jgi:hypothetical protein
MTTRKNIFNDFLIKTLNGLADLAVISSVSKQSQKGAAKSIKTTIDQIRTLCEKHNATIDFFHGTTLAVPEYLYSRVWLVNHPHRPRTLDGDEVLRLNEEIERRLQAQFVVAGFELCEAYLRDIGARALFQVRNERGGMLALPNKRESLTKFKASSAGKKVTPNTFEYFQAFMKYRYKSGYARFLTDLAGCLTRAKGISHFAERMSFLIRCFRLIQECRHVTVHQFGRHDPNKVNSLNNKYRIDNLVSKSLLTGEQTILPTDSVASNMLEDIAGITLYVYRGLSLEFGMKDDLFPIKSSPSDSKEPSG